MSGRQETLMAAGLLLRLASGQQEVAAVSLREWDLVVRQAMRAGILARLCFRLDAHDALEAVPERPRLHLEAARVLALKHERDVRWEVASVRRLLAESGVPITLLKGAAYLMADLPPARGRLFSDVDFMVPRDRIDEVEQILIAAEWEPAVSDAYDQRYYRRWTHQIPPLRHFRRQTTLDVHHTIVPPTARSPVRAEALAAEAVPLGDGQLRILAPADMVLHAAVHLFNEGEFDRGLRDLLDIADLLQRFAALPDFWESLARRAAELGLTGPLYLTLRYLDALLGISFPKQIRDAALHWQPSAGKRAMLDALFLRALPPNHHSCDDRFTAAARWVLYVRAHYLRMPLHLLLPHLLRKSFGRSAPELNKGDRLSLQAQIEEFLRLAPPGRDAARSRLSLEKGLCE